MKKTFAVLLCCLLAAACSNNVVYSDYDHSIDFRAYKTFAWLPNPVDAYSNGMYNNQIVEHNVKNYGTEEMNMRGYQVDTTGPDLLLEYSLNIQRKERTEETPLYAYPYNYSWYNYPYYDPYHRYMYGRAPAPYIYGYKTEKIKYSEGTLTISVIDRKQNRLIWRGWNVEPISDPDLFKTNLRADIRDIFKRFPVAVNK